MANFKILNMFLPNFLFEQKTNQQNGKNNCTYRNFNQMQFLITQSSVVTFFEVSGQFTFSGFFRNLHRPPLLNVMTERMRPSAAQEE